MNQEYSKEQADELQSLRQLILQCPAVDPNSEAMLFALKTLDEVKEEQMKGLLLNGKKGQYTSHGEDDAQNLTQSDPLKRPKEYCTGNRCGIGGGNKVMGAIRFIVMELPLVALFTLCVIACMTSYIYDEYLDPQFDLFVYDEVNRTRDLTFYNRECSPNEITTLNPEDLYIQKHYTTNDNVEHMLTHGMSIYRDILKQETAAELRDWVLERNKSMKRKDEIDVLSNTNRWSFYIGANDHPSVTKAIHEVVTHQVFRPALEKIVGANPAIIEMTAITSAYGAEDQDWHHDIIAEGSPAKYAQSFIPSYSLFMALQDTTAAMGATEVCPGTYMCSIAWACDEYGFQVSGSGQWKQGDAIFMNQQSFHRGAAHVDPDGPHRALFIITFAPRPMDIRYETRLIGQGGSYSLRWDMWGHTLDDFEHAKEKMRQPWTSLKALGLYKPVDSQWGWDWITQQSMRLANDDTGYGDEEKLQEFVRNRGIGLPKFLSVSFAEGMSWRDYLRKTVTRCKIVLIKANVMLNAILLCIALLRSIIGTLVARRKGLQSSSVRNTLRVLRRIMLYYTVLVLAAIGILRIICNSYWAMGIKNRTLYSSPFPIPSGNGDPRPVAVVTKYDVLLNDRLDFKNLGSLSDALDYQGGNIKFRATVRAASKFARHLKTEDVMRLVLSVLNGMRREVCRLLYQNESTDWVVLSDSDATAFTMQAILLESVPILKALHKETRFLLASYKYGRQYKGAMAKLHSPLHIHAIMKLLMNRIGIKPFYLGSPPTGLVHVKYLNTEETFIVPTKRSTLQIPLTSSVKLPTSRSRKEHVKRTYSMPWNVTIHKNGMLVLGDIVEAQYNGIYNEYYKGKIVKIKEGSIVDVEYTDGELDLSLEPHHLRKFVPYTVGEEVQVKASTNEQYLDAEIIKIISSSSDSNDDQLIVRLVENQKKLMVSTGSVRRIKKFFVGDVVEFVPDGEDEYMFRATVVKENVDGTVNIKFEDGETMRYVEMISISLSRVGFL
eukprot:CAMPEP_0176499164 /NCGR_PEP_ID=MMETSP0200_2-20121128/12761_1 /TAXON_ID=947934 /ORGANISM="Chaetoceros sp., Strain GSL56" /LENGTH=1000 /DNA_ID=CAMNT_0017897525 /DNA_START=94 /DNA_END=3096 /DNA_ORIENTATION=+